MFALVEDSVPPNIRMQRTRLRHGGDVVETASRLVEGLVRIEEVATESGADAYIRVPFGPREITEAIKWK